MFSFIEVSELGNAFNHRGINSSFLDNQHSCNLPFGVHILLSVVHLTVWRQHNLTNITYQIHSENASKKFMLNWQLGAGKIKKNLICLHGVHTKNYWKVWPNIITSCHVGEMILTTRKVFLRVISCYSNQPWG